MMKICVIVDLSTCSFNKRVLKVLSHLVWICFIMLGLLIAQFPGLAALTLYTGTEHQLQPEAESLFWFPAHRVSVFCPKPEKLF